jgi:hypothetical protein
MAKDAILDTPMSSITERLWSATTADPVLPARFTFEVEKK